MQLLNACEPYRLYRTTAATDSSSKDNLCGRRELDSPSRARLSGSVSVRPAGGPAGLSLALHQLHRTAELNLRLGVCYCCCSLHADTTSPSCPTTQWSMPYDALALLRLLECCSLEQPPTTQLFAATMVGKHSIAGATPGVHNLVDVERTKQTIHRQVHAAIDLIVAAGANQPQSVAAAQ